MRFAPSSQQSCRTLFMWCCIAEIHCWEVVPVTRAPCINRIVRPCFFLPETIIYSRYSRYLVRRKGTLWRLGLKSLPNNRSNSSLKYPTQSNRFVACGSSAHKEAKDTKGTKGTKGTKLRILIPETFPVEGHASGELQTARWRC